MLPPSFEKAAQDLFGQMPGWASREDLLTSKMLKFWGNCIYNTKYSHVMHTASQLTPFVIQRTWQRHYFFFFQSQKYLGNQFKLNLPPCRSPESYFSTYAAALETVHWACKMISRTIFVTSKNFSYTSIQINFKMISESH